MKIRPMRSLALRSLAFMAVPAAILATSTMPAIGQIITEDLKLTASDAAAADSFGFSVAVSGRTAIIGSRLDSDDGEFSGAAYLFDTVTGQQLFKLTASDAAAGDRFGHWVAISGDIAVVGSIFDSDAGEFSGSAYVFDTLTGQQRFKLTAQDAAAGDRFGFSAAMFGTTAIIGATGDDGFTGAAYLFDVTTGEQLFKLTANDGAKLDTFGSTVGIFRGRAIVGAPNDDDAGDGSGSAYVFNTATGTQQFKLTASDAVEGDRFGGAVAVSDRFVVVGAVFDDDGGTDSGSAYVFDTTLGQERFKLVASDDAPLDFFGSSVAISGTTVIVAARRDDVGAIDSGSAYAFDVTTGDQLSKLVASDASTSDFFGSEVAISGATAVIGARQDDDGGENSGSAYVYSLDVCRADWSADGSVNIIDVISFINNWDDALPDTDFNADGSINILDVIAFIIEWNAGCP